MVPCTMCTARSWHTTTRRSTNIQDVDQHALLFVAHVKDAGEHMYARHVMPVTKAAPKAYFLPLVSCLKTLSEKKTTSKVAYAS